MRKTLSGDDFLHGEAGVSKGTDQKEEGEGGLGGGFIFYPDRHLRLGSEERWPSHVFCGVGVGDEHS